MFSLIKKDIISTFRLNSIFYIILYTIVTLVLSMLFGELIYWAFPLILSFIFVFNSFHYDYIEEANKFILSLPVKKEDVVYSKYIFSIIMILSTTILAYLISALVLIKMDKPMVFQDVIIVINIFLLAMAVILPIKITNKNVGIKYLSYLIAVILEMPLITLINTIAMKMPSSIERGSITFPSNSKFNLLEYLYTNININYINFTSVTVVVIIIFVISIFLSLKIYSKNDIR